MSMPERESRTLMRSDTVLLALPSLLGWSMLTRIKLAPSFTSFSDLFLTVCQSKKASQQLVKQAVQHVSS